MTRFLLRETVSQLQALQSSLEGASDTLETQASGPRYMRSRDNLWVQFMNPHYLHVPSPSTLTTFHSFSILEPKLLFWAGRPRRGERNAGFDAGANILESLSCLAQAWPYSGVPVLGPVGLPAVDPPSISLRSFEERTEVQSRPCSSRRAGRRALRSVSRSPTWSPGSSDIGAPGEWWEGWLRRVQS